MLVSESSAMYQLRPQTGSEATAGFDS